MNAHRQYRTAQGIKENNCISVTVQSMFLLFFKLYSYNSHLLDIFFPLLNLQTTFQAMTKIYLQQNIFSSFTPITPDKQNTYRSQTVIQDKEQSHKSPSQAKEREQFPPSSDHPTDQDIYMIFITQRNFPIFYNARNEIYVVVSSVELATG